MFHVITLVCLSEKDVTYKDHMNYREASPSIMVDRHASRLIRITIIDILHNIIDICRQSLLMTNSAYIYHVDQFQ